MVAARLFPDMTRDNLVLNFVIDVSRQNAFAYQLIF
jgi:hypothetical protein